MKVLIGVFFALFVCEIGLAASTDCNALWKKRVSLNKKGVVREYLVTTKFDLPGMPAAMVGALNQNMKQKHEIVASGPTGIKTRLTTTGSTMPIPVQVIHEKKGEFVKGCKRYIAKGAPVLPKGVKADFKVLSTKMMKKSVKAGTFSCSYSKIKSKIEYNGQIGDGIIETWLAGKDNVGHVVLMVQNMIMPMGGMKGKLISRMELIK